MCDSMRPGFCARFAAVNLVALFVSLLTRMLLLRIIFVLALITLVVSGAMYLVTRDRRYLRFIFQTLKYFVFILLGILAFMALERVVLIL